MPIVFHERDDSRYVNQEVNSQSVTLHWFGSGSLDEAAVRAALLLTTPITWDGLALQNVRCVPLGSSGNWDCFSDYAYSPEALGGGIVPPIPLPTDPLGIDWGFDLTAQTAHVSQGLKTVSSRKAGSTYTSPPAWEPSTAYSPGNKVITVEGNVYTCNVGGTSAATGYGPTGTGTGISDGTGDLTWNYFGQDVDPAAPDYKGAIGVTADRIAGCDVYYGHLEFTITRQVYPVTEVLITDLLGMVGTINAAEWRSFPAKSLLYLGATGTPKPGDIWTLTHRFAASPPATNVPVGPITVPVKAGWDFLWVAYGMGKVGNYLLQVPQAAYVEQVYRTTDFTLLPI